MCSVAAQADARSAHTTSTRGVLRVIAVERTAKRRPSIAVRHEAVDGVDEVVVLGREQATLEVLDDRGRNDGHAPGTPRQVDPAMLMTSPR